jgi:outer membrane cobalamin receptor
MRICQNVLLLLIAILPVSSFAQTTITGKVTEAGSAEPLIGATVAIKRINKGTTTDNNGNYNITLKRGSYKVLFSYIGYQPVTKEVKCTGMSNRITVNVQLKPSATNLNEVTVTAKSVERQMREKAMPVSVITMKELQGTVSNISDVLSKTSGVTIRATGGVGSSSRISVRGLEGKRIGFYIDESPMNENSDFVDINDIPVDLIERVEIYKGIVPAKFGGSTLGGAVNIVLKEYPPEYYDASYSIQSYNTHKVTGVYKRNKNGYELGAGGFYTSSDNDYKMTLPKEFGGYRVTRDHDKFRKFVVGGGVKTARWWFSEFEVEPALVLTKKEIQGIEYNIQNAESSSTAFLVAQTSNKEDFLIPGLDLDFDNTYTFSNYFYVDTSRYVYNWAGKIVDERIDKKTGMGLGEVGNQPNDMDNKKHVYLQHTNFHYTINSRNAINLNSSYRFAKGLPKDLVKDAVLGYKTNYSTTLNSLTLGLSHEFNTLDKRLTNAITAKGYYYSMQTKLIRLTDLDRIPTDIDNQKSAFGISEAFRYRFIPELLVKASVSYDVRLPTDEELLGDGFMIAPAGNLNPEKGLTSNLGFMFDRSYYTNKRLQIELNLFYYKLEDMIRFTGGPLQNMYQNFGEMQCFGGELEVKWDALSWLYLWANGTYQDLRDTRKYDPGTNRPNDFKGDRMPNIPYFFINGGFELHKENLFGGKGQNSRLFVDGAFIEEYFYDFEESIHQQKRIPQTLTFNAGVEHSIMNQSLFFSIQANNITDANVMSEFNRPLPGINFGAKIRYVWK